MQVPKIGLIQTSHLIITNGISNLALRHLLNQIFRCDGVGSNLMDAYAAPQLLVEVGKALGITGIRLNIDLLADQLSDISQGLTAFLLSLNQHLLTDFLLAAINRSGF